MHQIMLYGALHAPPPDGAQNSESLATESSRAQKWQLALQATATIALVTLVVATIYKLTRGD